MKKYSVLTALLCLLFVFQFASATNYPPRAIKGLEYDGTAQYLVEEGTPEDGYIYYYRDLDTGEWGLDLPERTAAGTYTVEYLLWEEDADAPSSKTSGTRIKNITIAATDWEDEYGPIARRDLVYNGSKQYLIEEITEENDPYPYTYYFRNRYTGLWDTDLPEATNPGTYTVEYILSEDQPDPEETGIFIYNITIARGNYVRPSITTSSGSGTRTWYWLDTTDSAEAKVLPGTGFPTRVSKPLSVQPENLAYNELNMRIQIPVLDVDVELTGVPENGNSWAVDWLEDRAGVLSGTYLPGSGSSIVAAHNHLSDLQIGPFGLLFELEENDRIFVNTEDGQLLIFSVYANELLDPEDMATLAAIAEQQENSLVLVTCENEMTDGSYLNRRVVFARPLS